MKASVLIAVAAISIMVGKPASAHVFHGCIGESLTDCKAEIKTLVKVSEHLEKMSEAGKDDVDVNGKKLRTDETTYISGGLKGVGFVMFVINTSKDGAVSGMQVTTPADPRFANTQKEYRKTGLYPAVRLAWGDKCNISELEVYKFFQNQVKAKIVTENDNESGWMHEKQGEHGQIQDVQLCGHKFGYHVLSGYDTDEISVDNPKGVYDNATLYFE